MLNISEFTVSFVSGICECSQGIAEAGSIE